MNKFDNEYLHKYFETQVKVFDSQESIQRHALNYTLPITILTNVFAIQMINNNVTTIIINNK